MTSARDVMKRIPGYYTVQELVDIGPQKLTIKDVRYIKILKEDDEEKPVIFFEETPKRVTINKTRSQQLSDLFGDEDLVGKRVTVKADVVLVNNRRTEMIVLEAAG